MNNYAIIWNGELFSRNFEVVVVRYDKKRSLGYADGVRCAYLEGIRILYTNKNSELFNKIKNEEKAIASDMTFKFDDGVKISVIPGAKYTCTYLFKNETDNGALTEFNRIKNKISLYEPYYNK